MEEQLCLFLTCVLDGGQWSASCPGHFNPPGKRAPSTWRGGCVGSGAGMEEQLCLFLTCVLDGGQWSASCPGHFNPPGKRAPSTWREVGCVGSGSGTDTFVYERNLLLMPRIKPQRLSCPACTLVTKLTTLFYLPWNYEVHIISVGGQFSCLYFFAAPI